MFKFKYDNDYYTVPDIRDAYETILYIILLRDYNMDEFLAGRCAEYLLDNLYSTVSFLIVPYNVEDDYHEFDWNENDEGFELFNQTIIMYGLEHAE